MLLRFNEDIFIRYKWFCMELHVVYHIINSYSIWSHDVQIGSKISIQAIKTNCKFNTM